MIARALLLCLVLAWPLQAFDEAVKERAQAARRPWLEEPMHQITNGGRPLMIVGSALLLVTGVAGRAMLVEAALALAPVNLAVEVLKYATNRQRPNGDHNRRNAAFPSSHAANAFAVAVILVRRWRRAVIPAVAAAVLVAISRVYLNKHWCMDVIAGAALGSGLAWWAISWWRSRAAAPPPQDEPAGA